MFGREEGKFCGIGVTIDVFKVQFFSVIIIYICAIFTRIHLCGCVSVLLLFLDYAVRFSKYHLSCLVYQFSGAPCPLRFYSPCPFWSFGLFHASTKRLLLNVAFIRILSTKCIALLYRIINNPSIRIAIISSVFECVC